MMDRQYIQENQVVERYLRGALSPEEQEAFEACYLADSEVLEELELAERLKQGLESVEEEGGVEPFSGPPGRFHHLVVPVLAALATPQYAAAASVALVVSLVFSGLVYQENQRLTGEGLSAGSASRLEPIFAVRGAADGRTISSGVDGESVVLLLDPGPTGHASYRATVNRLTSGVPEEVVRISALEPGFQDYLAVSIPGGLLTEGEYQVLIEGRMAEWPAEQYEEVTRLPFQAATE